MKRWALTLFILAPLVMLAASSFAPNRRTWFQPVASGGGGGSCSDWFDNVGPPIDGIAPHNVMSQGLTNSTGTNITICEVTGVMWTGTSLGSVTLEWRTAPNGGGVKIGNSSSSYSYDASNKPITNSWTFSGTRLGPGTNYYLTIINSGTTVSSMEPTCYFKYGSAPGNFTGLYNAASAVSGGANWLIRVTIQ